MFTCLKIFMDFKNIHGFEKLFMGLPSAEDLARASTACISFHRLVANKSFLRRFCRLHDPPLLAFFDRDGFHHALPPHPFAPAAGALAAADDFSFSFFPNHRQWSVQDIREGRLLLIRPGDGEQPQVSMKAAAFFVPLDEEAGTTFDVMRMVHFTTRMAAFVYSSTTEQWQAVASKEWNELLLGQGESTMVSPIDRDFYLRQYAYGCFYWESTMMGKKDLLVFDTPRMEFSSCDTPPRELCLLGLAIVEAGEARLGLFGIHVEAGEDNLNMFGSNREVLAPRKVWPMRFVDSTPHQDLEYISVDVKTLQLAKVCTKSSGVCPFQDVDI
ncbi:hypothetical protein VPH35_032291 [Triticum aestivum]